MGCAIAHVALRAGYRVILEDVSPSALENGVAWITRALDDDVSGGRLDAPERSKALLRLATAHSAKEACREADLVIETVADEEEVKLELFTIFDKFGKPGAIFASTTEAFSISELADITVCPERCVGMRFFGATSRHERMELVRGRQTSDESACVCGEVAQRLGMEVTVTKEERSISVSGGSSV